jgi:hypothetical protein
MATHNRQTPPTAIKLVSPVQRIPEQSVAAPEAEPSEQTSTPGLAGHLHGQQQARMMQRMQRAVGNAQVQRMLKAAPAQQRTSITPPAVARSTIAPVQRTAAPTATIQRSPEIQVAAPASVPVQRTAAPIQRGWRDWGRNALNAGKSFVNTVGNAGQQGAKFLFEQALSKAGVDPKRVMSLINRAGGAVGSIISNPGRFATTLVNAVRQGFGKFQGNIGTHLQAGFSGWLLGTTGVTVPKDFSPPSVLSLVLQVLKITSATIQQRLARQIGDKNAARMEQAWGVIGSAMSKGPGGLWTMLKEYLGDLKTVVIDGIKEWVIGSVVKAAVGKIASMFSPATGMIAAIKTIYDVATFLIERAGQLKQLFQAVGDSASALAQGNTQQAASKIEQTLARAIPVAIGFLASLVGLRNVAAKVKEIIGRVRDRIQGAIDKMIAKVLSKFKGTAQGSQQPRSGQAQPGDAQARLRQGVMAGVAAVNKLSGKRVRAAAINPLLLPLKQRYRLGVLEPVAKDKHWAIHGEIRRMTEKTNKEVATGNESIKGSLALYRGIHFRTTWSQADYDRQLRKSLIGQPTFSAAAREIAGSKTPDGSDVSPADLEKAARIVQEQVAATKNPESVRQWWNKKQQTFDNLFLAMLQRYVNGMDDFARELSQLKNGVYKGLRFTKIPFISTTKNPAHAARYAIGQKATPAEQQRTSGIVGRVFVYLFKLKDLADQGAVDIQSVHDSGKVKIKYRYLREEEVTFTGSIPGENLAAQIDANGGDDTVSLGAKAEQTARQKADGGLRQW